VDMWGRVLCTASLTTSKWIQEIYASSHKAWGCVPLTYSSALEWPGLKTCIYFIVASFIAWRILTELKHNKAASESYGIFQNIHSFLILIYNAE